LNQQQIIMNKPQQVPLNQNIPPQAVLNPQHIAQHQHVNGQNSELIDGGQYPPEYYQYHQQQQ
jgi:hypothetical protein